MGDRGAQPRRLSRFREPYLTLYGRITSLKDLNVSCPEGERSPRSPRSTLPLLTIHSPSASPTFLRGFIVPGTGRGYASCPPSAPADLEGGAVQSYV